MNLTYIKIIMLISDIPNIQYDTEPCGVMKVCGRSTGGFVMFWY